MSAISEKINETRELLAQGPTNIVLQRVDAINEARLSAEMLIQSASLLASNIEYTVTLSDDTTASKTKNFFLIAFDQARVRTICEFSNAANMQFFNLGTSTIFDTNLDFTFPTNKTFGVQILNPESSYEIKLTNTPGTSEIKYEPDGSSNTFSTYAGDYYFVQSRSSGSLIGPTDFADVNAVLGPNLNLEFGVELPFNTSDIDSVKGTWNYSYIPNNIESVNTVDDLQFVTLSRDLQDGYDSSYSTPKIYTPLYIKRRRAIDGQPAHSLFAIAVVICEGLKINLDWLPVGDGTGDFSDPNAAIEAALVTNNYSFTTRLGLFDPNGFDADTSTNDLYKSLDLNKKSSSQELPNYGSDTYPYVNRLPFFPAIVGSKNLQPINGDCGAAIGENDLFVGRYVLTELDRLDENGSADNDYRYVVNQASKFFFENDPLITLNEDGTVSIDDVPKDSDPQAEAVTNLDAIFNYVANTNEYVTSSKYTNIQNYFSHGAAIANSSNTSVTSLIAPPNISGYTDESVPSTVYIKADGRVGTSAQGDHTYAISSDTNLYYYFVSGVTDGYIKVDETIVSFDFSTTTTGNSTAYSLSVTSSSPTTENGYFKFNDVNELIISDRFTRINDTINNLYSMRNDIYDPYFDDTTVDGEYSSGRSRYSSFDSALASVYTLKGNYLTHHTSIQNSVTATSPAYNGSSSITYNYSLYTSFLSDLASFDTQRKDRITDLNTRIGNPVYTEALSDPNYTGRGTARTYKQVDYIPSIHTTTSEATQLAGITPYGRKLYDILNIMLDNEIGYIIKVIKKVYNLAYAYDEIKKNRNKFEVYNDRSKPC